MPQTYVLWPRRKRIRCGQDVNRIPGDRVDIKTELKFVCVYADIFYFSSQSASCDRQSDFSLLIMKHCQYTSLSLSWRRWERGESFENPEPVHRLIKSKSNALNNNNNWKRELCHIRKYIDSPGPSSPPLSLSFHLVKQIRRSKVCRIEEIAVL